MKKSITISIPEPCHEDWAKMNATEKGKFCAVCTKEVIDFTKTTDEDLVKKLSAGGNLCGRFNKSQLNREVKLERKSRNSILPYAASLLLPLSILSSLESNAQGGAKITNKPMVSLGIGSHTTNGTEKSIVSVSGVITDEQGNAINNAEILVLETGDSFFSEKDGTYQLKCVSGSTLVYQKAGRSEHQVVIGGHNSVVNVLLQSEPFVQPQILGRIRAVQVEDVKIVCETPEVEELTGDIAIVEETTTVKIRGMMQVKENISEEKKEDKNVITIAGTITDEMGYPLAGVTIIQKDTSNGTQTDFDGNYTIKVAANSELIFSYLGYETKNITLSNINNTLSFAMVSDDSMILGEVVTTGIIIVVEEGENLNINPYRGTAPEYDHDTQLKREARRKAAANEHAFKAIKRERKKNKE